MTSPPQPHRPLVTDDLDLGVSGAQIPVSKRQAINDRQREAALAEAEHDRWYAALKERLWGRP